MKKSEPSVFDEAMKVLEADIRAKTTDYLVQQHLEEFENSIRPKISKYVESVCVDKMVEYQENLHFRHVLKIYINNKLAGDTPECDLKEVP